IAYYQERVKEYFSYFSFNFKNAEDYSSWVEFTNDVNSQGYQIWFTGIPSDYIEEVAKERKIFLFQIYNKDFSPYAKGRPNMHTLYWKSLFEPQNLQNVVTKLNGKAEIFFRYKSIKKSEAVVHKANQPIKNKNENNPKNESLFDYDITKDRRYTVDKFLFHVPITINFKQNKASKFNERINTLLSKHPNTHIIGIDRGERHLLYYTLISPDGKIIKQKSFNTIPMDKGYSIDYRKKLDAKEKERDRARKDWGSIENIKELKAGYLSQVVHELAKLIVDYSAIVVLEDLNFGFKRGRFKVEKQVYQKFEKVLINKLNYLVFKNRDAKEPGGYLNGYQLTAPFESFAKLGKQSGILFYVPAAYTSKIDPATGFIDFLKPKYESVEKSQTFFSKFQ
ncbi:MAG: type V CRISPR-associated protein Cas12a/Cpf1, partial [Sulfurovum sp.]|nr:type V CRISPR-associated protein Cas12a/Cpf1 [Sulfurovum sp.]